MYNNSKDMKTLTNTQFNKALEIFQVKENENEIYMTDEIGEVAFLNPVSTEFKINDVVTVFDDEYTLTKNQKDIIYTMLENESKQVDNNSAFDADDYEHFTNLIYS